MHTKNGDITTFDGFASSTAGKGGLGTVATDQHLERQRALRRAVRNGSVGRGRCDCRMFDDFLIAGGTSRIFSNTSFNVFLDGLLFGAANSGRHWNGAAVRVVFEVNGVNIGGGFQVLQGMSGGARPDAEQRGSPGGPARAR